MFPPGAVPVQNLPPEMLRALQASLAEAFQDRDAARRQFFNGNAAVSDDAVDAAIQQFRESLSDPDQAAKLMMALSAMSSFAPPPPRDLAMPDDEDSDSGSSVGMPTLEDQDAPVFRPPPPPINDILGPTTEETDSEEYTDEEDNDDDVDVEEVERRKRYERALAKFPYQGDLGRAVRAQDREAIRLINRMRTAFETREDTASLEEEARALVVRKRAETPSVKAPSARRREQEEKVRKAALLKQKERAAAQQRAEAEAELAAQKERERQEALREAQAREAEEQRRAALMAEAQARREAAAREEAERRGAAERTAEAERLASERDAEALARAAERDAEASAEQARAAAAQRAVHAAKVP